MFYIDQLRTPSFPIGLAKTESGFIVRSPETDLGRWTLVVAVISIDAYLFLAFSDLTCHLEDTGMVFSGCLPPDSKKTKLRSSNQKASLSAGKNTGAVLQPCSHIEVSPYSYFRRCGYFWGPWVSFVKTDEFSVRVTKITSRIGISWTHNLPFYFQPILTQFIMTILSKGYKPDNFESQNSLKLSFTNNWSFRSNFTSTLSREVIVLVILIDCMTFLSPFLDATRISMSTVSFLAQLECGILCL